MPGTVDINRITRLAQPRHQLSTDDIDKNIIAESALKYVATERITVLARPRLEKLDDVIYGIPRIVFRTNPDYASVKSLGIDKLACARNPREKYRKVTVDVRCAYR